MVQVTEGGYDGMLNLAQSGGNRLYFLRKAPEPKAMQAIEVDLDRLFADSRAGQMKPASHYQRVIGTLPPELEAVGDNALDADGQWFYFRIQGKAYAGARLPAGTRIEPPFGPRGMGAGPHAIGKINVQTGEIRHVVSVPFQIGHIQANLWNPGELIFSWETGGKSPQRTWTVHGDGSGLRPLYPEAP
jgi:oligogalacturonide lyase